MSALLAHAKALHALGSAFQAQALKPRPDIYAGHSALLLDLSKAFTAAADDLGQQMRAECSGEGEGKPAHQPRKGKARG